MLKRQAVRAVLLTPQSEVLLLRIHEPGDNRYFFWITPGGGIEPGESSEEGLHRELQEELGLEDFVLGPLVWRRQHTFNWGDLRMCQYEEFHIAHVERFEPRMSDAVEAKILDRFCWWPLDELTKINEPLVPTSLVEIVKHYLADGAPRETLALDEVID
jgi:8-oxo-dGTP pyrophosphatase MutT (NUDIX family)